MPKNLYSCFSVSKIENVQTDSHQDALETYTVRFNSYCRHPGQQPAQPSLPLISPTSCSDAGHSKSRVQATRASPPDPAQLSPLFSIFDCRMILVLGAGVHVLLPGKSQDVRATEI